MNRRAFIAISALASLSLDRWILSARAEPAGASTVEVLTQDHLVTLDALGDALLPGARVAGLSRYVRQQLAIPTEQQSLFVKYLIAPPFSIFYSTACRAIDVECQNRHGHPFDSLSPAEVRRFTSELMAGTLALKGAPPADLIYLVVRNDALDVVYGVESGFEGLGIPYMPHIRPSSPWPT